MKRKPAKSSAKKTKAKATVRDLKPRKQVKGGTLTKSPVRRFPIWNRARV